MLTFSSILAVVAGSAYVYFFFSLVVSGINEWYARFVHRRARVLEAAMPELLGSVSCKAQSNLFFWRRRVPKCPNAAACRDNLATNFGAHPLIAGLASDYRFPSYIPPLHIGMVLVGLTLDVRPATPHQPPSIRVRRKIRGTATVITDAERKVMTGLIAGETNVRIVQARIEKWFDESGERVSGSYKRRTYRSLLFFSAVVTLLFNIDSILMFQTLAKSADATPTAGAAASALPLALGWNCSLTEWPCAPEGSAWAAIGGLLLTTLALTLGAPFWFDVLSKWVNLRQTGTPPQDRREITG